MTDIEPPTRRSLRQPAAPSAAPRDETSPEATMPDAPPAVVPDAPREETLPEAAQPDTAPRVRRPRGADESLATIVLAFESVVVFLGGLAIYGLKALPDSVEQWWGIVAGVVVAVLMVLTTRVVRYPWGIGLGWALQLVVALGAILVPSLGLVALIFGGMYGYATIKGAALDRRNAQRLADSPDETDAPTKPEKANGD